MRILRVRKGFSTNCSGANEYFPPPGSLPAPTATPQEPDWSPNPDAKILFRWITPMPDGGLPPIVRRTLSESPGDASPEGGRGDGGGVAPDGGPGAADGVVVLSTKSADGGGVARAIASGGADTAVERGPASAVRGSSGVGLVIFVVVLGVLAFLGFERLSHSLRHGLSRGADDDDSR